MRIKFSHKPFFTYIPLPKPEYHLPPMIELSDDEQENYLDEIFGERTMTDAEIEANLKWHKEKCEQRELELYECGIEPLVHNNVHYFIMSEGELTFEEYIAVVDALSNILASFDIHSNYSYDELWEIVKGDKDACFYEDCKNYVVDISVNGAAFIVDERFDSPSSLSFTGEFIRQFLWAYLTMIESAATPYAMDVNFKKEWIIFD